MEKETIQIQLSSKEINILKDRSENKGFFSFTNYIENIIKQVVEKIEKEDNFSEQTNLVDKDEEELVKKKLKELGYLN